MSGTDWKDVSVVLANGETATAKACYVGDGWCDVIVNHEKGTVRLWMLADGSADPPLTPCRLASPFPLTPQTPPQASPVTIAERFLSGVLRLFVASAQNPASWVSQDAPDDIVIAAGDIARALESLGFMGMTKPTPKGEALLARVDAAERAQAMSTLAALREAISNPPDGDDDAWCAQMMRAFRAHESALAGTAPLRREP